MIEIQNVNFRYSGGRDEAGLHNITLTVPDGEVLLVCGGSGCGKSTLTRLVNGLIPHFYDGELSGKVTVNGLDIAEAPLYDTAKLVGSVFQNPRSQFFNVDTTSELAFSCENMGMPEPEVRSRMEKAVGELNLRPLLDRSIFELSGGEKQRIACGSVSTLSPEVMVLDEPTSNLDFPGIKSLRNIISLWKSQGRTVMIAEHRLHFLKDIADRVIYMESGDIREQFSGSEFFAKPAVFFEEHGLRAPELSSVFSREFPEHKPAGTFSLRDFSYSYKNGVTALDIPNAELPLGSVIAIIGSNGAGKTTFMRTFCGLIKKCRGTLELGGKSLTSRKRIKCCYLVMQDVNHQLFTKSVLDEVLLSMDREEVPAAEEILRSLDLLELKEFHPMSLSSGQKQRVAIASALASGREFIVFDEPTSGLGAGHMQQAADCILSLKKQGRNVMIVTHDPEFISRCCDYAVRIEHGGISEQYALDRSGRERLREFFVGVAEW